MNFLKFPSMILIQIYLLQFVTIDNYKNVLLIFLSKGVTLLLFSIITVINQYIIFLQNFSLDFLLILILYLLEVDLRKILSQNDQLKQILDNWFREHFSFKHQMVMENIKPLKNNQL